MSTKAEPIVRQGARLGEGAIWDARKQCLYWVDITGQTVFVYNPKTGKNRPINVGTDVGTVVPRASGGVILAVQDGFSSLDLDTGKLTQIASVETDKPNNRFNDGKCDPAGRFWAGSLAYGGKRGAGSLYCMDADHSVHKMLSDITCSNGIVWTRDEKTMYYIDTGTSQVAAFDYDKATRNISNRRVIVKVPPGQGHPDGMAIDAGGNIWVAIYGSGEVRCWNPSDGELLDKVEVPGAKQTTSCAFGGRDLKELYITSAADGLKDAERARQPLAGALFRANPGVRGVPSFEYAG